MNRPTKSSPLPECEAMNLSLTDLYMRLKAYEDTGLEPEEVERCAKEEKEGRLLVLPCGDDVTPIKCTGLKCPMQAGKVDPVTCKAADTCKWATKPLTNADIIRAMSDEELARVISCPYHGEPCPTDIDYAGCLLCAEGWLKQEAEEE